MMMPTNKYSKRAFISFDGKCPMQCKHCYTYELNTENNARSIDDLVGSLSSKDFDIIYISQSYENFFCESKGVELCQKLYHRYKKDIFVITRRFLSRDTLHALSELNSLMQQSGNEIIIATSIIANESYGVSENTCQCASPEERLLTLEEAKKRGLKTMLMLRPIFPDNIIPTREVLTIISLAQTYVDAVVSSGLIVNKNIMSRLNIAEDDMQYLEYGDSEYLADFNDSEIRYLNVENEIESIKAFCISLNLPFYKHSIPALNHIVKCN